MLSKLRIKPFQIKIFEHICTVFCAQLKLKNKFVVLLYIVKLQILRP